MKRLGLYSGIIYTKEDAEHTIIPECCVMIPKEIAADKDSLVFKEFSERYRSGCKRCSGGCPMSRMKDYEIEHFEKVMREETERLSNERRTE